ncbi:MAG: hypothetical protein ACP5HU_10300 [Phycisphaerae bacterium]
MKPPNNTGLFYQLGIMAVLVVGLMILKSSAATWAHSFTPDELRLAMTYLAFGFAAVVLLNLAYSNRRHRISDYNTDARLNLMETSLGRLNEEIAELVQLGTKSSAMRGFMVSAKTILKEEADIAQGEVWVYTPELTVDTTPPFLRVISANISRGIHYYYFLRDVPDLHGDFARLTSGAHGIVQCRDTVRERLHVTWLRPAISRPGGITIHVHSGDSPHVAAFGTIPHEQWGKDFFIRMDQKYATRAFHYLKEVEAEHHEETSA